MREKVDADVRRLVKAPKNACVAVGILRDGVPQVVGSGPVSASDPAAPDGDTLFEIGSVTKTFTALLLWQEVRAATLALDDPISKHLPKGTRTPSRHGKEITLLQLATHTSGLPALPSNFAPKDGTNPYADYTTADLLDGLGSVELEHDPGERYQYSNLGMGLLGEILALKAGRPYETLVAERVCRPLGLNDTTVRLAEDQRRRLALGHGPDGQATPNWDVRGIPGAGALRSTVRDLLRYLEAHLDAAYAPTRQPRASVDGAHGIGLGWHLLSLTPKAPKIVWHNGGTGGYRSFVGFVPETRTAVVVLTNCTAEVDTLGIALLKRLQDVQ
ncbi:MAG: beta-lactamase family protein [Planctomycetaceae bacterium]|nr:beta-lactamase family protein [Planctomycetaceae bacterium]